MTLKEVFESTVEFLGIDTEIFYTDESNMPNNSKGQGSEIKEEESYKIYIDVTKINTTSELIGTVFEEVSHAFDHQAGRQLEMTAEQKARGEYGLESLGRATNVYFQELYKENDSKISLTSDGVDYSNVRGNTIGYKYNEGYKIYKENLLDKGYTREDIQNNIKWWYFKEEDKKNSKYREYININWDKYETNADYQKEINYYYFQAKYFLRIKSVGKVMDKYVTITQKNGEKMTLNKVSESEFIYHNIEYKDDTVYFHFDEKYKKYVHPDGYELILDKNNNPVYDPTIVGTYNFVTYKTIISKDAAAHFFSDVQLWKKYGSGPTDPSPKEMREKVGDLLFSLNISTYFNKIKGYAQKMNKTSLSYEEISKIFLIYNETSPEELLKKFRMENTYEEYIK